MSLFKIIKFILQTVYSVLCSAFVYCKHSLTYLPGDVERRLGSSENLLLEFNKRGFLYVVSVVFLSSKEKLKCEHIHWALTRLMKIHPLLRMRTMDINGYTYWKEMAKPEPDIKEHPGHNWHNVFTNFSQQNFEYTKGPLWRVGYVTDERNNDYQDKNFQHHSALVFSFCHSLIDAQARMRLMDELQDLLALCVRNNTSTATQLDAILEKPISKDFPPSFDAYVEKDFSFLEKIKLSILKLPAIEPYVHRKMQEIFALPNPFDQCVGSVEETIPDIEKVTDTYTVSLSEEDTQLIIKASKQEGLTVHSLLQAASILSLCNMIREGAVRKEIPDNAIAKSSVNCAAGVRQNFEIPNNTSYVASMMCPLVNEVDVQRLASLRFWEYAKETMKNIHTDKAGKMKGFVFSQTLLAHIVDKWPKKRVNLLSFTNIGNCNYLNRPVDSGLKITAQFSCCSEHICGPVFANSMATINNKLCWGAGFYTNVTTRNQAQEYLDGAIHIVLQNCKRVVQETSLSDKIQ